MLVLVCLSTVQYDKLQGFLLHRSIGSSTVFHWPGRGHGIWVEDSDTATSQHTSSISTSSTTSPPVVVLPWTQKHSRMMCLARLPGNTGRAVLGDSQNK